jgi:hypothetical protein
MYLDSGGDPEYMTKDEVIEYMESDEWKKEKEWEARNG